MAIFNAGGVPFHGEFTSSDASALSEPNSRFTLYQPFTKTALTLAAADKVVVTDIWFWCVGAIGVSIYDGTDTTVDAGEKIWGTATVIANTNVFQHLITGHHCITGTYPKVKTSAGGQIDAIIRGYIIS